MPFDKPQTEMQALGTLGSTYNEQLHSENLARCKWCSLKPNFFNIVVNDRNVFTREKSARYNRTRCKRDPVYEQVLRSVHI